MNEHDILLIQVATGATGYSEKYVNIPKGGILTSDANQTPIVVPIGATGTIPVADPTATGGIRWATGGAGSTGPTGATGATGPAGTSTFLALTDTPAAYTGQAGKIVKVNSGATGLEFGDAGASADEKVKYNASDVSSGYLADKVVAGTGIALAEGTSGDADKLQVSLNATFLNLTDTPSAYTGITGEAVTVKDAGDGLETTPVVDYDFSDLFITTFTDLTDTPSDLSTLDGEVVVVNSAGTALETDPTVEVGWAETTGHPVTTDTVLVLTLNGQAYQINVKKV